MAVQVVPIFDRGARPPSLDTSSFGAIAGNGATYAGMIVFGMRSQERHIKIGIIGAGMIGETLARRLRQLGHQVAIANSRAGETLRDLASEVGATAVTALEAARHGEIVVITIPERAVPDLPRDLFAGVPADVVVIDTGNYYPSRDGRIDAIENGQPESAWVAEQIGRPVIKAFNNIVPTKMGGPGAPDDLEQGHLTQAWLAVSDDPAATVSGRYWHHRRPQTPAKDVSDPDFQDQLSARLVELTGVSAF